MVRCPECDSKDIDEGSSDSTDDYPNDNEGSTVTRTPFTCNDCECEFTIVKTEETTVEIDKKGMKE